MSVRNSIGQFGWKLGTVAVEYVSAPAQLGIREITRTANPFNGEMRSPHPSTQNGIDRELCLVPRCLGRPEPRTKSVDTNPKSVS